MPAAAVIPAPIAYIKVVAVKKLVVGFLVCALGPWPQGYVCRRVPIILAMMAAAAFTGRGRSTV